MSPTTITNCVEQLLASVEAADYAGYDPYDALNSAVLRRITSSSKWLRIAATQTLKRCPVNLRAVLGVRKGHNAKGIGLCLWAYARLYSLERKPEYLQQIDRLLDVLEGLKSKGYSGNCWGYNFDWQSRTYLRPKGTPTVVNTSFIGHALLDCFHLTGRQRALEMAIPIKDFILCDLNRTRSEQGFCFSYTPIDNAVVHNANLLGASILIRLAPLEVDGDRLSDTALASLKYSMHFQREDGSWLYANTDKQRWVDSFHTGFNLQAIRYFLEAGVADEYRSAYHRGVRYYADRFFLEDGMPKYYNDRLYPIDIHAPTQAICFFCREGEQYRDLTDRVLQWMLQNMYDRRGYFYFRRGRILTNRVCYMRWAQAWALHALTEYLYSRRRLHHDGNRIARKSTDPGCPGHMLPIVPTCNDRHRSEDQSPEKDLLHGH